MLRKELAIKLLKSRMHGAPSHKQGHIKYGKYHINYTDMLSLYIEYKDIFIREIYRPNTTKSAPIIIDGGSCIGISVLYFKLLYPNAKIICFEPDPEIYKILQQNITQNNIADTELVMSGLAETTGVAYFEPDGSDGGKIVDANKSTQINVVKLSDYITTHVDFLKLNIEGKELPVLLEIESANKLKDIDELVIEYHGWYNDTQKLGDILNLLARNGFRYMIHDFDSETNGVTKPPFHLMPNTTWFCLIYATKVNP